MVLADRLARGGTPEARMILANTIVILVPSQNPDGVDIVGDWYRSTLGTPAEGTSPAGAVPSLHGPRQQSRLVRVHAARDAIHRRLAVSRRGIRRSSTTSTSRAPMREGSSSRRTWIPIEPNIDPILTSGTNALGQQMTWRMIADGKTGIATNASYDQWSPARQYSYYHRGARILTETASARLATPIDIPFDRLGTGRGYDARVATWNYPVLWPGGHWTYGDIVDYQVSASWALLVSAARDRRAWLESYAAMGERALGSLPPWGNEAWPTALLIPKAQPDAAATQRMIWMLQHGQVEIRESTAPVTVDGKTYASGSYGDPHAAAIRRLCQGAARAAEIPESLRVSRRTAQAPIRRDRAHASPPARRRRGGRDGCAAAHRQADRGDVAAGIRGGVPERFERTNASRSTRASPNRWTKDGRAGCSTRTRSATRRSSTGTSARETSMRGSTWSSSRHRMQTASSAALARPIPTRSRADSARKARKSCRRSSSREGRLLAFNDASDYAIEALKLPVKNVLAGVRQNDFYAPGSILGVTVDRTHPIANAFTATVPAVWFENGPAFEITDATQAVAVAKYPASGNPLLSGWLLGGERINGKAALVDVTKGKGHAVLFGFRPQYRGQSMATYSLIWGAILR